MKTINKEVLKIAADKIMLDLDEEQYDSLIVELKGICQMVDAIKTIPGIDEAEPMTFPFDNRISHPISSTAKCRKPSRVRRARKFPVQCPDSNPKVPRN